MATLVKVQELKNYNKPKSHINRTSSLQHHVTPHNNHKQFLPWRPNQHLPSPLIFRAPNNIFLRRRRSSHAIITPNGRRQKNGENQSRVRDFTVVALTIFSIKSLYSGPSRDPLYLCPQTDFRPAAFAARSRLLRTSRDEKRMVRIHCDLTFLQFFYSPFFQLN